MSPALTSRPPHPPVVSAAFFPAPLAPDAPLATVSSTAAHALTQSYARSGGAGRPAAPAGQAYASSPSGAPHPPVPSGLPAASAADVDMAAASPVASTSAATFAHGSAAAHPQAAPRPPYTRDFPPPLAPRHWTVLKEVGDGSFGTVWLADWHSPLNLPPGTQPPGPSSRPEYKGKQLVAIKRMKKAFEGGWDECMKLKELKSLRQIPMHPNIIPLYDAFLLPTTRELYFVFECMEGNLYQLTKSRKGRPLASGLIASIFYQIVAGLHQCHAHGYFHRDLKPENLLITTTGLADYPASSLYALPGAPPEKDVIVIVKLADFGLAREITSKPPYTEYVSTRWYRAPEVLLRSRDYSVPVDMWALGTILVEVVTLKPLFPGDSEVDQVFKICEVLGDPSTDYGVDERGRIRGGGTWARGVKMAKDVGFAFPKVPPRNFASLFDPNTVPVQLIDCIADLLRYEPKARLNTQQCLEHAYFREVAYRFTPRQPHPPPHQLPTPAPSHGSNTSYSSTHPGSSLSLNSASLSSAAAKPVSHASPRSIPPSHSQSQGSAPSFKLPYPHDPNGQALPSPDHYAHAHPRSHRNFSVSSSLSGASGLSGYQIQVQPVAADQQSVVSLPSPAAPSGWPNGAGANGSALHPSAAAMGGLGRRGSLAPSLAPSAAPSTYYDGSIFEGVTSSRASSIMSFPAGDSGGAPPLFASLSPQQSRASNAARPSSPTSSVYSQPAPAQAPPPPAQASASPSLSTRGRWGLFAGSAADKGAAPVQFATTGVNPLKRSPSNASMTSALSGGAPSVASAGDVPLDPKKARKEAEKLAKEQEKAARLAKEQQARERARAVMKKKSQLKEAADPLHNFALQGKAASGGGGGGGSSAANVSSSSASFLDKGKGRALPSDRLVQQRMPQIIEDTSRLQVSGQPPVDAYGAGPSGAALRYKARRRDEDDDVHSVSSNETGHSSQQWPFPVGPGRGRPFSISSKATSASDPERRAQQLLDMDPLARVSSLSSLPNLRSGVPATALSSGSMHRFPSYGHYTAPSTGHSSLDANFISNMQGLATSSTTELPWPPPGRQGAEYRTESRTRLASPHAHERYSPYMVPPHGHAHPRSPGPTLPPIQSFDTPPQTQHPLVRGGTAATMGGASIASFRSTPAAMPSYFVHPPGGADGADGAAAGGGTYHLPYLPAMDADSPAMSPVSGTFPYPSPSLSGTGAPDQHMPHQYTPG
ncbi:Serine/threonine protein kinase [Rhodotorula kratochvilovae]